MGRLLVWDATSFAKGLGLSIFKDLGLRVAQMPIGLPVALLVTVLWIVVASQFETLRPSSTKTKLGQRRRAAPASPLTEAAIGRYCS